MYDFWEIFQQKKDNVEDDVRNNTYYGIKWSAPIMESPKDIKERIDSFNLCGRKIKHMRLIGSSIFHDREWIESMAYGQLVGLPEEERRYKSSYSMIDDNIKFSRYVETDDPLLIEFEDGDIFEIITLMEPEFKISMNCGLWQISSRDRESNIEAEIMFAPCIGQTIIDVEVNTYTTNKHPSYTEVFDEPQEFVSNITFRLENGIAVRVSVCCDFFIVECIDINNKPVKINFSELKQALFNWEDIHEDAVSGFETFSPMLFCGEKGAERVETPYITLYSSSKKDSRLYISVEDFFIIGWSILVATKDWFDEYGEYCFTYKEWYEILDNTDRFFNEHFFNNFIEKQCKSHDMVKMLNLQAALFWKYHDEYKRLIKDLWKWSALVMTSPDDTMNIYGF